MHSTANLFARLFQNERRTERRASPRSCPSELTACHLMLPGEELPMHGWVNDISVRGMSLLCERSLPPGTALEVALFNGSSTFALTVAFEVLRCQTMPSGTSLVGGQFTQQIAYENIVPFLL